MVSSRTVLYFAPVPRTFEDFRAGIDALAWTTRTDEATWSSDALALRFETVATVEEARRRLGERHDDLLVIDCRHLPHDEADAAGQEAALLRLLEGLNAERARETAYPFARIVVLVGDADEERVDRLIFDMGRLHVGLCLRDLSLSPRLAGDHVDTAREACFRRLWDHARATLLACRAGKKAVSAAGGGITGIYYELGVLKCLHDANVDLGRFDMYLGISAGAFVMGCLANGYSVDEMIANVGGLRTDWPERVRLRWRHLNVGELPRRVLLAQQDFLSYVLQIVRGEAELSMSSVLWSYETLLGPMFDNTGIERFLRELYTRPGCTNDFKELRAELYIGVTDQDRREHVLFGDGDHRDVPISVAIQASTAAHPFFRSVEIDGRYYTDGMLTRTNNIKAAIDHGADLLFLIDPFVPLISDSPGDNARHGNLWLVEQDIKTLAYTRFEQVSVEILRRHPHVHAYTFVPSKRMRRLMSQNPFAASNFHPIVCEAYRSTYRRLSALEYKMRAELDAHGVTLDLEPVAERVARLERAPKADASLLIDEVPAAEAAG